MKGQNFFPDFPFVDSMQDLYLLVGLGLSVIIVLTLLAILLVKTLRVKEVDCGNTVIKLDLQPTRPRRKLFTRRKVECAKKTKT